VGINIKNPETQALAHELAALTGESMTGAITTAVRERRDRVLAQDAARVGRMRAISEACAARIPAELKALPHGDLLYGADGLPA
jgi:antitoxin VapB